MKRPPFLEIREAVVRRQGKAILSVDEFFLPEGECMAILGPNGSGKSTFVGLVTREVFPLYREVPPVVFRGNERTTLSEVKRILGVVSSTMQNQITVHLPVIDVVVGGLFGALGVPKRFTVGEEDRARALKALDELGIADLADRDVMTLSTGQARRVLIARSLVHDPEVLIFDEPCTGLDPEGMFYVRQAMRTLVAGGRALILVTHYPEDIVPEISRVLLLKEGRIFADGPKEQLLTDETMSSLFNVPLHVQSTQDFYSLVPQF